MKRETIILLVLAAVVIIATYLGLNLRSEIPQDEIPQEESLTEQSVIEGNKYSYLDEIDREKFLVEGGDVTVVSTGDHFSLKLEEREVISSVDSSGRLLAVVSEIAQEPNSSTITTLTVLDVTDGSIVKSFKTGDQIGDAYKYLRMIQKVNFSIDGEALYLSTTTGYSSGLITTVLRVSDYTLVDEFRGHVISVLPSSTEISNVNYRKYSGYLLVGKKHEFVTGGGVSLVDIVHPTTFEVSKEKIFGDDRNDIETFYNLKIFSEYYDPEFKEAPDTLEIENPELRLPEGIYEKQIGKYFGIEGMLYALVQEHSMNLPLFLPDDQVTSFTGILRAANGNTEWTKYLEIEDQGSSSGSNPYYMTVEDDKLLLTVVNQNGAGSGEGDMAVFLLEDDGTWTLSECYYFGSYNHYEDYFMNSILFEKQVSQGLDRCIDISVKLL